MKKLLLVLTFISVSTISCFSQITTEYDKFENFTHLSTAFKIKPNINFIIMGTFQGKKPSKDSAILVTIGVQIYNKSIVYGDSYDLNFLIDDNTRMSCNNGSYGVSRAGNYIVESITYIHTPEEYLKPLTLGTKVEGQFVKTRFTFTPAQLQVIKDFYKRLTP